MEAKRSSAENTPQGHLKIKKEKAMMMSIEPVSANFEIEDFSN